MEMPVNTNQRNYSASAPFNRPYLSNTDEAWITIFNPEKWLAGSVTVMFHLAMGALLFAGWVASKPAEPEVHSMKVQMISLKIPAPVPQVVAEPALALPAEPIATPQKTVKPPPQKAEIAFKQVEEKPIVEEVQTKVPVTNTQPSIEQQQEVEQQAQLNQPFQQKNEANEARQNDAQAAAAKQIEAAQLANNQYLPVEKNAPAYPERALEKGLEGSCTVSYNVNTQGRVEAPKALDDCHPLFIKASIEATKFFKYMPRVVDGKAVIVSNVKNTFQYRIQ